MKIELLFFSPLNFTGNFAKNLPSAASDSDLARYRVLRKDLSTHSLRSLDEHPLDSGLHADDRRDSSSSAVTKKILKPVRDATQVVGNRVTQVSWSGWMNAGAPGVAWVGLWMGYVVEIGPRCHSVGGQQSDTG